MKKLILVEYYILVKNLLRKPRRIKRLERNELYIKAFLVFTL